MLGLSQKHKLNINTYMAWTFHVHMREVIRISGGWTRISPMAAMDLSTCNHLELLSQSVGFYGHMPQSNSIVRVCAMVTYLGGCQMILTWIQ